MAEDRRGLPRDRAAQHGVKIAVYSGLTLTEADILSILPHAIARPPVRQFDLLADVKQGVHVVVIVDGVFHQIPAVSPIEIMDALRCGVLVYGCSSMGALRAAELRLHGMRGVGKIFDWVCSDPTFRDDFPAQAFAVEGERLRPLSVPFVDFAFNLQRLLQRGSINRRDFRLLSDAFQGIFYPERTLAALISAIRGRRPDLVPIVRHALTRMPSQKRIDAVSTLRRVKRDLTRVASINLEIAGRTARPRD